MHYLGFIVDGAAIALTKPDICRRKASIAAISPDQCHDH
jgi:hypothetical protein